AVVGHEKAIALRDLVERPKVLDQRATPDVPGRRAVKDRDRVGDPEPRRQFLHLGDVIAWREPGAVLELAEAVEAKLLDQLRALHLARVRERVPHQRPRSLAVVSL